MWERMMRTICLEVGMYGRICLEIEPYATQKTHKQYLQN